MNSDDEALPELKKSSVQKGRGLGPALLWSGFFVASLAAVIVLLSWSFGWVAVEKYKPDELFEKYVNSRPESRPLILVEWMRMLSQNPNSSELLPTSAQEDRLRGDLESLSVQENSDKNLAAPLISLLSFAQNREATAALFIKVAEKIPSHQGLESQIALLFALGRLGIWNEQIATYLAESARDSDVSIRKTTAYVLGSRKEWPSEIVHPLLRELLKDSSEDTRWNAAISLYRLGSREADPRIEELIAEVWTPDFSDRASITLIEENLYAQLFTAFKESPRPEFRGALERISKTHPHVKMRRLAMEALNE